ncbi:Nephrocystin-3 [Drechslerella dactyloides]|uniref:Nephrocystin-3 n=1 Tax=Drechslerella dactyloides TaxID=74499 RepID=A0AAD6ITG3_DREDA|nr:Nephrocystin-3 [Drechslerella dactyloides]
MTQQVPNRYYTIAWICALPVERIAGDAMLDVPHERPLENHPDDHNTYQLGSIGKHNVVIACLPLGCYGTTSATIVATQIKLSFPSIKIYLMVGVGGGIPNADHDVRLGDIVVSKPENSSGGVVQYDLGKTVTGGRFERSGALNKPPPLLLTAIAGLKASHELGRSNIPDYLAKVFSRHPDLGGEYAYQGRENDALYKADYEHEGGSTCELCHYEELVPRKSRNDTHPVIHYGTIASGNQVIKDGVTRDRIGNDVGAICFEMEAAGLMDHFPCLVIRGICDYSDSHKNKRWQSYAALTAAAYAKELLYQITPLGAISLQPTPPIFDIPRILHRHFSGRQTYLTRIHNSFHSNSGEREGAIVSVFGIPGVGKSQLCLKYAADNGGEYNYGFYATASTTDQWLSGCDNIIRGLSLPEANSSEQAQRTGALKRWFSANHGWILVIDDVTLSVVSLLRETLPQYIGGHILLSTRDKYIASEFSPPGYFVHLREMDLEEGKELVFKIYNQQENSATAVIAENISRELGGLPLALEQGTTCAAQRYWELNTLLDNLRENKQVMLQDPLQNSQHADIIATLDMALKVLEPAHITLLNLILMMRPQALPLGILIDGAFNPVRATTTSGSIDRRQDLISKEGKEWTTRFRKRLRAFIQPKTRPNLSRNESSVEPVRLHIFQAIKDIIESKSKLDSAIVVLEKSSLLRRGESGEIWVHDLFREILQGKLEEWERKDFLRARYGEALQWFERVLAGEEKALGKDHPSTLCTVHSIASVFSDQGKHDEAMQWFERALAGKEKALGKDHPSTLDTVNDIAGVFYMQGKYDEAMQWYERALAGREKALGKDHPSTLTTLNNIASVYTRQGKYGESMQRYERALAGEEKALGKNHPSTLDTVNDIAGVFYMQGKYDEAMQWYERALAGREKALGKDHPSTLNTVHKIASVFSDQGKHDEAMQWFERALAGKEKALGKDHPSTLCTVNSIALVFYKQGKYDEAVQWFERALAGTKEALGKNHPSTLVVAENLRLLPKIRTNQNSSKGQY